VSLSKHIIFGTDKEVADCLEHKPQLNVIDEYGYSPLIQTSIVDSPSKTKLLLDAGAEVDFKDVTTRTALHWAASNSDYEICKLLINHGANANIYTNAGQPVLVMPYLRRQKNIQNLLIKHGAKLDFTQDFINAKLLGHRFELEGRVDIIDNAGTFIEVELEGFYLEFSLEILIKSLHDFKNNFAAKHLRDYFTKLNIIINALQVAVELIKYQHYLIDIDKYAKRIDILLNQEPLILPISFDGHAITLIRFGDWLVRCDRGEFGKKNGTVNIYDLENPHMLTESFLRELLYKKQYSQFINSGLSRRLGLNTKLQLPLAPQKTGNCSWANVEAVVPTIMFLLFLQENGINKIEESQQEVLHFYNEWVEWDRNRELHFCLESFEEANPARKATKAALLAAILFQSCQYDNSCDQQKVAKILPILTLPDYSYILKSYVEVFAKDQRNKCMDNLHNFLDDFGVNVQGL
jgi:hypothetical protein